MAQTWKDRPDYVPSTWSGGSLNRWVAAKPQRMLITWILMLAFICAVIAWAITDPHGYFHTPLAIPGLIGAAFFLLQSVRYLPRIVRARNRH